MPVKKSVFTTTMLARDVARRVKTYAAANDTTMLAMVDHLLRDGMDRLEKETTTRLRSSSRPSRTRPVD
jgi:hypothetical protein